MTVRTKRAENRVTLYAQDKLNQFYAQTYKRQVSNVARSLLFRARFQSPPALELLGW
jgi:hypothetical protein